MMTLIVVARITRASRLQLDAEVSERFLLARSGHIHCAKPSLGKENEM